jgi:uncharacterized protein (DUF2336 family)
MRSETNRSPGVNAALLRAIVEQFVSRPLHPASDVEQFERLALGLIDALDAEDVAGAAGDLCLHPETPASIVARLFDKGGGCARAAFEFAPHAGRADLLATAEYGPEELAAAIARRADLDRETVGMLAARGEGAVLRALAGNAQARLDYPARRALALAGRDDLDLGRILLDRADLDIDPETLFLAATRAERAAIMLEACRCVLADGGPDSAPRAAAAFVARLEALAMARDRDAMIAALADALDCRKSRVRAIVADAGGEALALAFVALGVGAEPATRIFLCADPCIAHDHARVRSLLALMRSTPRRAAARIVAAVTGSSRHEREPGRRQPGRDEAQAQPSGWRRTAPARSAGPASRAVDRST